MAADTRKARLHLRDEMARGTLLEALATHEERRCAQRVAAQALIPRRADTCLAQRGARLANIRAVDKFAQGRTRSDANVAIQEGCCASTRRAFAVEITRVAASRWVECGAQRAKRLRDAWRA